MKTKGKVKHFQCDWYNKKDGEMTYGNFRKWFVRKKTCRYLKHKKRLNNG